MIVETGLEIRSETGSVGGYLGILNVSPRTYGSWTKPAAPGAAASHPPPKPVPSVPLEPEKLSNVLTRLRHLAHRRHRTYGLPGLWNQFRELPRAFFRRLAAGVRAEVMRARRKRLQRYEFLHPDIAHSLDYTEMPREGPGASKRYLAKIMDDFARLKLKHALTNRKGPIVAASIVDQHLSTCRKPLVFKFDLEFDTEDFYELLLLHKVVPLPSPASYPPFNGKTERSYRDVKDWLREFQGELYWSVDELEAELQLCFQQLDEIDPRPVLGGLTARDIYETSPRAEVNPEIFFSEAITLYDKVMRQTTKPPRVHDAWRYVAKETLKQYGLVRYSRP